jgi:hypothetical protein
METSSGMGGFIPLWILGAGLLAGIVELMRSPTPRHRDDRADRSAASDPQVPHTGAYRSGRPAV